VPDPANPQSLNRYSYCLNNPLRYIDPSGHFVLVLGIPVYYWLAAGGAAAATALIVTYSDDIANSFEQLGNYLFSKKGGKSDKSGERAIREKVENIDKHRTNLSKEPNSQAKNMWENEIKTREKEILKELEKLGPAARQRMEEWLRNKGSITGEGYGINASSILPSAIGAASLAELNNSIYSVGTPGYQAQIGQAFNAVHANLGANQMVGWSSDKGYYAADIDSYDYYDDWYYWD
jgi:hypothetical protein